MIIWYVQECFNTCDIVKRGIIGLKRFFNIIDIKKENDKTICYLPIYKNRKIKKITRIAKKLSKILYNNDVQNVVLSQYLNENNELKNNLFSNNINILDGKKLFNFLSYETIKYILNKQNKKFNEIEVSILINDNNETNLNIIKQIANNVKSLTIITNHINKFRVIEKNLLEEYGIMIRVANNYKQSLSRSKLILNIDFPEELISKYNIYTKAIIISLNYNLEKLPKKFEGINIKSLKLNIPEKYKMYEYGNEIVYESLILNLYSFNTIKTKTNDEIEIEALIGSKGKISDEEITKIDLTKIK